MSALGRLLVVVAVLIVIWLICRKAQRSNFNFGDDSVCDGHCFRDGNGHIMDVYDCCECKATVTNQFEPNFHKCMCEAGYKDYCYIPVTNLLLSQ